MDADAYEAGIIEAYEAKLREKDKLITELCDALEGASQWPPHQVLIQRARKAGRGSHPSEAKK